MVRLDIRKVGAAGHICHDGTGSDTDLGPTPVPVLWAPVLGVSPILLDTHDKLFEGL